eukprot:6206341-Pleurochrysis_carterae.AAC.5
MQHQGWRQRFQAGVCDRQMHAVMFSSVPPSNASTRRLVLYSLATVGHAVSDAVPRPPSPSQLEKVVSTLLDASGDTHAVAAKPMSHVTARAHLLCTMQFKSDAMADADYGTSSYFWFW